MTLSNFNQINTKGFKPKRDLIYLGLFIVILVGFILLNKSCEKSYLNDAIETRGVIIEKSGGYNSFSMLRVQFTDAEGKLITSDAIQQTECFNIYNEGDSVKIKYSSQKHQIVEILNCKDQ